MFSTIDKTWVAGLVGAIATILAVISGGAIEIGANLQTAIIGFIWSGIQMYLVWRVPNKDA